MEGIVFIGGYLFIVGGVAAIGAIIMAVAIALED